MITSALALMILAGVLSSYLMLARNSYNASNYTVMEAEARRALETFTDEARMAKDVAWNSSTSLTLTVAPPSGTYQVTYAYDSGTSGSTAKCFYRVLGTASSTATRQILVRDVQDFAFRRYKVVNGVDYSASNNLETKQLQITLRAVKSRATVVSASNTVLSARVVLRNKKVTT